MKYCPACDQTKPTTEYYPDKRLSGARGSGGLLSRCKGCHTKSAKSSWQRRREKQIAGVGAIPRGCQICGLRFVVGTRTAAAHWDHDHGKGTRENGRGGRGWLCVRCNAGLGNFGDNPRALERAAAYLRAKGFTVARPVIR